MVSVERASFRILNTFQVGLQREIERTLVLSDRVSRSVKLELKYLIKKGWKLCVQKTCPMMHIFSNTFQSISLDILKT